MKKKLHKIQSEICNEKGDWNKPCLSFGQEIKAAINPVINKYKGKISLDAMLMIIITEANFETLYNKAMDSMA